MKALTSAIFFEVAEPSEEQIGRVLHAARIEQGRNDITPGDVTLWLRNTVFNSHQIAAVPKRSPTARHRKEIASARQKAEKLRAQLVGMDDPELWPHMEALDAIVKRLAEREIKWMPPERGSNHAKPGLHYLTTEARRLWCESLSKSEDDAWFPEFCKAVLDAGGYPDESETERTSRARLAAR